MNHSVRYDFALVFVFVFHYAALARRNSRFNIFPVGPLGRESVISTTRGYLYAASFDLQNSIISDSVAFSPGFNATIAFTSSPYTTYTNTRVFKKEKEEGFRGETIIKEYNTKKSAPGASTNQGTN